MTNTHSSPVFVEMPDGCLFWSLKIEIFEFEKRFFSRTECVFSIFRGDKQNSKYEKIRTKNKILRKGIGIKSKAALDSSSSPVLSQLFLFLEDWFVREEEEYSL
jgi:hypothetical protein